MDPGPDATPEVSRAASVSPRPASGPCSRGLDAFCPESPAAASARSPLRGRLRAEGAGE